MQQAVAAPVEPSAAADRRIRRRKNYGAPN